MNGWFLLNLVRPPHTYRYDPANYHGPTLYYLAWASSALFGLTTFSLRLVPALCGLLTIALILPLRRQLGDIGTLAAMALLTLSPGAVFQSRYFIHESILVCATLGLVVGVSGLPPWKLDARRAGRRVVSRHDGSDQGDMVHQHRGPRLRRDWNRNLVPNSCKVRDPRCAPVSA